MTYAVGQTIEVCLEFDLPPTRGIRRIVGIFVNERGKMVELTDVPARMSECILQEPSQTALQGRAAYPGTYEMRQLKVKHLEGVTYMNPPEISFEVKGTPDVAGWHLAWRQYDGQHVYDASYWYNWNLGIIANIEREFPTKNDLNDIQYYFAEHRPPQRCWHACEFPREEAECDGGRDEETRVAVDDTRHQRAELPRSVTPAR